MRVVSLLCVLAVILSSEAHAQILRWTPGWDVTTEPLNLKTSSLKVSFGSNGHLTLAYTLVGAEPSKLYQVGINRFCEHTPNLFGRFPYIGPPFVGPNNTCLSSTRQGQTFTTRAVLVGVILTDAKGNGSTTIDLGVVASGSYQVQLIVEDGAGCGVSGGAGNGDDCYVAFQAPAPFGNAYTLTVP